MDSQHEEMAKEFDEWYTEMLDSPRKDEDPVAKPLRLPPELLSTSLLPWEGIAQVAEALSLEPGQLLVDLACGRGGYGLELAARTDARLIGIDFAAEAVRQARDLAAKRGVEADFRVGDLVATGLAAGSVDAAVVVDAIRLPSDPAAAYAELARILRPGGHAILTCWEPLEPGTPPCPSGCGGVDLKKGLASVGFVDIHVREQPEWHEAEHSLWVEAAALDPGEDPALAAATRGSRAVIGSFDRGTPVMATAVSPPHGSKKT